MHDFTDEFPSIDDTSSRLTRSEDDITLRIDTAGLDSAAYTVWVIAFVILRGGVESSPELAADENLLHYRIRSGRTDKVRVAAEQFFFQEGMAKAFDLASYAEMRITPDGRTLLVALRDHQRRRIGEKPE